MEYGGEERAGRRGWFARLHLSWPMLFVAGWLLYELTTQPMLGAVAVCLKFGWEDFRAAIWLRRVDPRRLRGRACFWLYLASGLAKTAGVAGLMSLAFVVVSPKGPAAQGPRWAAIMEMAAWTGLAMLTGLGCVVLTFAYAVVLARWGGFKLWLSRDIHAARRRNDWPPYGSRIVQNNRVEMLLSAASIIGFFPLFFLFGILLILAGKINDRLAAIVGVGEFFFLVFGYPLLILIVRDLARRWLIASHPGECWDHEVASTTDTEDIAEIITNPVN